MLSVWRLTTPLAPIPCPADVCRLGVGWGWGDIPHVIVPDDPRGAPVRSLPLRSAVVTASCPGRVDKQDADTPRQGGQRASSDVMTDWRREGQRGTG